MLRHGLWASLTLTAAGLGMAAACGGNVAVGSGGGTTTQSSGGGTTTQSSSSGTTTQSSSSGTTTSTSSSSGGSCGTCQPDFICCNGTCVNPLNDFLNCGTCGNHCTGTNPYCHTGVCGVPACVGIACPGSEVCCGTMCCGQGEICCDIYGPVQAGEPNCTTPQNGTCPGGCTACQCASPDTPIATPTGDRAIADLAAGDLVYSVDHGAVVAVPILRVNRTPQRDHHVVRVRLATGAVLEVSPRHPTADGRTFADLRAGQALDGIAITSVEVIPYAHPFTHDILPASETRTYYAAGALIGTTLAP